MCLCAYACLINGPYQILKMKIKKGKDITLQPAAKN